MSHNLSVLQSLGHSTDIYLTTMCQFWAKLLRFKDKCKKILTVKELTLK